MKIGDFEKNLKAGFQGKNDNMTTEAAPTHLLRLGNFFLSDFEVVLFVNLVFQVRYFYCF